MNDLFRFIGKDGSLGYETNRIYMLQLDGRGFTSMGVRVVAPSLCLYDTWNDFFKNWERV